MEPGEAARGPAPALPDFTPVVGLLRQLRETVKAEDDMETQRETELQAKDAELTRTKSELAAAQRTIDVIARERLQQYVASALAEPVLAVPVPEPPVPPLYGDESGEVPVRAVDEADEKGEADSSLPLAGLESSSASPQGPPRKRRRTDRGAVDSSVSSYAPSPARVQPERRRKWTIELPEPPGAVQGTAETCAWIVKLGELDAADGKMRQSKASACIGPIKLRTNGAGRQVWVCDLHSCKGKNGTWATNCKLYRRTAPAELGWSQCDKCSHLHT